MTAIRLGAYLTSIVFAAGAGRRLFGHGLGRWLPPLIMAASAPVVFAAEPSTALLGGLAGLCAWLCIASVAWKAWGPWLAAIAGASLGVSANASFAAAVVMVMCLVLTVGLAAYQGSLSIRDAAVMAGSFLVGALPTELALIQSGRFTQVVVAHHLYDAHRFTVLQGLREMSSWVGLSARSSVYWDYLDPVFLARSVLWWPVVPLLGVGVYRVAIVEPSALNTLMLGGLLAAPIAGALTAEPPVPGRIIWVLPFAAVLATHGVLMLTSWFRRHPASV